MISHADGSIKFWDASGCNLLFLYKLRTNRLFDRAAPVVTPTSNPRESNSNTKYDSRSSRTNSSTGIGPAEDQIQQQLNILNLANEYNGYEYPYAIYSIRTCCDGKYLIAAARGGHVTLFKFTGSELDKADEGLGDLTCLEIPILHRNISNDHDESNTGGNNMTNDVQRQIPEKKVSSY